MFKNNLPTALMFALTLVCGMLTGAALHHRLQSSIQISAAEATSLATTLR